MCSQTQNQVYPCLSIDIEDVNKDLKDIKTVLDSKTSEEDLEEIVKDQTTIESYLCDSACRMCGGRA